MIHRTRRHAPTLAARRGMRAAWFRGRFSGGPDTPADPGQHLAAATDPDAPVPPAGPREGDGPADASPTARSAPALLKRPDFGHPIF